MSVRQRDGRERGGVVGALRGRLDLAADDLAWLGLAVGALVLLAALKWVAPGLEGQLEPPPAARALPRLPLTCFVPEPLEEARFLIAIALPVGLAIAVALLGSDRSPSRGLELPVIAVQLAALGFVGWTATQQSNAVWVVPDFVSELTLSVPVAVGGVVIGLVLTALLFFWPKLEPVGEGSLLGRLAATAWLPGAVAVVATVLWLLPAIVTDGNVSEPGLLGGHVPAPVRGLPGGRQWADPAGGLHVLVRVPAPDRLRAAALGPRLLNHLVLGAPGDAQRGGAALRLRGVRQRDRAPLGRRSASTSRSWR